MGKFKRNYADVDRSEKEVYSGDEPTPGIYDFVLSTVGEHTGGDAEGEKTVWTFDCTQEPFAGWRGWVYTNDSTTAWKEVQILEALGLMDKDETSIDLTHEQILKKAGPVRCKVTNEKYEGATKGRIKTVLPPRDGQAKPSKSGGKAKKKKGDGPF